MVPGTNGIANISLEPKNDDGQKKEDVFVPEVLKEKAHGVIPPHEVLPPLMTIKRPGTDGDDKQSQIGRGLDLTIKKKPEDSENKQDNGLKHKDKTKNTKVD